MLLNRVGLVGVNRFAKRIIWVISGDQISVEVDSLRIVGSAANWSVLSQIQQERFEPFEVALFLKTIQPGAVVLDIGANIGWYTVLAARQVGEKGHVYALEPDPRTLGSLHRNVDANGFANVTIIPIAASDQARRQVLYQGRSAVFSGLSPAADDDVMVGTTEVETATIDDLLGAGRVDVIKIDIEGHEPAALRGMKATLRRNSHAQLFLEFSPETLRAAGTDPDNFARLIMSAFTDVKVIDERKAALRPFTSDPSRRICNLVCSGFNGFPE
jgi:FkbM family methyltransferase